MWSRRRAQAPAASAGASTTPLTGVAPPPRPVVREVAPGVLARTDLPPPADDDGTPTSIGGRGTPRDRLAAAWRRLSGGDGMKKAGGVAAGGGVGGGGWGGGRGATGPAVPTLRAGVTKFAWEAVGGVGVGGARLAAHRPAPQGW